MGRVEARACLTPMVADSLIRWILRSAARWLRHCRVRILAARGAGCAPRSRWVRTTRAMFPRRAR